MQDHPHWIRRSLRGIGWLFALGCGAVLLAGFGGAWHPALDSLALLRIPAAAGCLIFALLLAKPRAAILPAAAASATVLIVLGAARIMAGSEGQGITVAERVPLHVGRGPDNAAYLDVKRQKSGHLE